MPSHRQSGGLITLEKWHGLERPAPIPRPATTVCMCPAASPSRCLLHAASSAAKNRIIENDDWAVRDHLTPAGGCWRISKFLTRMRIPSTVSRVVGAIAGATPVPATMVPGCGGILSAHASAESVTLNGTYRATPDNRSGDETLTNTWKSSTLSAPAVSNAAPSQIGALRTSLRRCESLTAVDDGRQ